MAEKHPNDDYINPASPTSAAPIPPEVFPDDLKEQQGSGHGGTLSEGGSGGTAPEEDTESTQAAKDADAKARSKK